MNFYRMSGLSIASEIPLPGLAEAADRAGAPDVRIRLGPIPSSLAAPTHQGGDWQMAGDTFLLSVPGVARFLLRSGADVLFEPGPGVASGDVAVYITGTVFGILLHQRGRIVLHASAVQVKDRAVLFCGSSGAGKSTMAAALAQRGYAVLNDDLCVVSFDSSGRAVIWSDYRRLKLWESSIARLELDAHRGAQVHSRTNKYYMETKKPVAEALPLGAVYELASGDVRIERLAALDAVVLLRRHAYRPPLIAVMRQQKRYFEAAATIAGQAGIFSFQRPFDLDRLPAVVDLLESYWDQNAVAHQRKL